MNIKRLCFNSLSLQEITVVEVMSISIFHSKFIINIWRPPSLSELTPMVFNSELTHLGLGASI